ncbi:MAG: tRNA (guanosine(37)-N1)-methyltransferase TrmD [Candidatus Krumholzibacteria bacterium]|nr:tRNA (guanosine(37)-N1)-methyltransferase TrmD [Candidatus Krumholzibacteria bacterium]
MKICFITIFPGMMSGPLTSGMLDIAAKKGAADYTVVNLRDFAVDKHGSVDDYPYGGGPGMVMMAPPVVEAVESVRTADEAGEVPVILMSPAGRRFDQSIAIELARHEKIVFVCGRYKGVDERVEELVITDTVSIGDYILSGGELPALVVADAIVRHLPGVIGDERSRDTDSFSEEREFMLDAAYFTRPTEYRGLKVPEILQSGNHAKIDEWRRESALERTKRLRPDLLDDERKGPRQS